MKKQNTDNFSDIEKGINNQRKKVLNLADNLAVLTMFIYSILYWDWFDFLSFPDVLKTIAQTTGVTGMFVFIIIFVQIRISINKRYDLKISNEYKRIYDEFY